MLPPLLYKHYKKILTFCNLGLKCNSLKIDSFLMNKLSEAEKTGELLKYTW